MSRAQKLIESVIDDGRLPADLIRDMIYGPNFASPMHVSPFRRENELTEDVGGDVSVPENPGEGEKVSMQTVVPATCTISVNTPESAAEYRELLAALDVAGIEYDMTPSEDQPGETLITWPEDKMEEINNILLALGYDVGGVDEPPEATVDYYEP